MNRNAWGWGPTRPIFDDAGILVSVMVAVLSSAIALVGFLMQAPAGWDQTYDKALALIVQGKPADAVALYERVLKGAPNFGDGHVALGEAYLAWAETLEGAPAQAAAFRRHLEAAATHHKRAIEPRAPRAFFSRKDLVDIYRKNRLNQPAEAEANARAIAAERPQSAVWHNLLASVLLEQGRYA